MREARRVLDAGSDRRILIMLPSGQNWSAIYKCRGPLITKKAIISESFVFPYTGKFQGVSTVSGSTDQGRGQRILRGKIRTGVELSQARFRPRL